MRLKNYIKKNERLSNLITLVTTKTFLACMLLALALWAYVSLNEEYITFVEVPLSIKLPQNRGFEDEIPKEISIEVKGLGWNLFNLLFMNTSARCNIDLSDSKIEVGRHDVMRNDILKSVLYLTNLESIDVIPENITIKTGEINSRTLRIKPNLDIIPRSGFMIVGDVKVKPSSVIVTGNRKVISELNEWRTQKEVFTDVFKPLNATVALSDSLENIVNLSAENVTVYADIQQIAEQKIPDVKLKLTGGKLPKEHIINNYNFDVFIKGPVELVSELDWDEVQVKIDLYDIISDSTGVLVPKVIVPKNIEVSLIKPKYIYHRKILKKPNS